jgi:carnosine N-methyltransferase
VAHAVAVRAEPLTTRWACPRCRQALQGDSQTCPRCGVTFPALGGVVPVLTRDPRAHLAVEAVRLHQEMEAMRTRADLCASAAARQPGRAAPLRRVSEALRENVNLLDRILGLALDHLHPRDLLAAGKERGTAYGASTLFAHLRRDLGREVEAEVETEALSLTVRAQLGRRRWERALVLGAGVGRLAIEVADRCEEVVALDNALVMAGAFALLLSSPLEAYHLQSRNTRTAADQVHAFAASLPPPPARERVRYVLGDGLATPLPDASVDLVLSVYFTDVVSPLKLLDEVARVLRPGGRFVHVGPLGYHGDDVTHHLSADELLRTFEEAGFDVSPGRWTPTTHLHARGSLHTCHFDNLVFSAALPREGRALRTADPTPPAPWLPVGWRPAR